VALTGDERRRWQELTRQLRRDRRLIVHSTRFLVVSGWRRNMANARAGTAIPAITWLPATLTACTGLILVGAGEYYRNGYVVLAGAWVLIITLILAGTALIVMGTADWRDERRRNRNSRDQSSRL
jgi:hypothetical protein